MRGKGCLEGFLDVSSSVGATAFTVDSAAAPPRSLSIREECISVLLAGSVGGAVDVACGGGGSTFLSLYGAIFRGLLRDFDDGAETNGNVGGMGFCCQVAQCRLIDVCLKGYAGSELPCINVLGASQPAPTIQYISERI